LIDAQNALTNARLQLVQTRIQGQRLQLEYLELEDMLLDVFPQIKQRLEIELSKE